MYCKNCGSKINPSMSKLCPACGTPVSKDDNQFTMAVNTASAPSCENTDDKDKTDPYYYEAARPDWLDLSIGIKEGLTRGELDTKRFKLAGKIMIGLAIFSTLAGLFLQNMDVTISGVMFLLLSLIFYMLKMPLALAFIAILMLVSKILTIFLHGSVANKPGSIAAFVILFLLFCAVQLIRSRRIAPKLTIKKIFLASSLVLGIMVAIMISYVITHPELMQDEGWTQEQIENVRLMHYEYMNEMLSQSGDVTHEDKILIEQFSKCISERIPQVFSNTDDFNDVMNNGENAVRYNDYKEIVFYCAQAL